MHAHPYFERKSSIPLSGSTSRSMTPKQFKRTQDDLNKSPERTYNEFNNLISNSPTVSSQKSLHAQNSSFGSSSKLPTKKDTPAYTDRYRPRQSHIPHSIKTTQNVTAEILKLKNHRTHSVVNKTEPGDIEIGYASQINKLLQKINKLKYDLGQANAKEGLYLEKLSNLEKENKSLHAMIEDKDKRMHEVIQKSKDDKIRMYQFLTELETYKQQNNNNNNSDINCRDDVSTLRLSDLCESNKKPEKPFCLDKGIQASEDDTGSQGCGKCDSVRSYCEMFSNKLADMEQASQYILQENTNMKESLTKAKRAETEYLRARSEIEKKALEIQNDYQKQANAYSEMFAENMTVRRVLKETSENAVMSNSYNDIKKTIQKMPKKVPTLHKFGPLPASLRAIAVAEKLNELIN